MSRNQLLTTLTLSVQIPQLAGLLLSARCSAHRFLGGSFTPVIHSGGLPPPPLCDRRTRCSGGCLGYPFGRGSFLFLHSSEVKSRNLMKISFVSIWDLNCFPYMHSKHNSLAFVFVSSVSALHDTKCFYVNIVDESKLRV